MKNREQKNGGTTFSHTVPKHFNLPAFEGQIWPGGDPLRTYPGGGKLSFRSAFLSVDRDGIPARPKSAGQARPPRFVAENRRHTRLR